MSQGSSTGTFRAALLGLGLFIGGCVTGTQELRMRIGADVVEGRTGKITERTGKYGRHVGYTVNYVFRDADGKLRKGQFDVGMGWTEPPDHRVEIRYDTDNPKNSRLEGSGGMMPIYFLIAGLLLLGYAGYSFWSTPVDLRQTPD